MPLTPVASLQFPRCWVELAGGAVDIYTPQPLSLEIEAWILSPNHKHAPSNCKQSLLLLPQLHPLYASGCLAQPAH